MVSATGLPVSLGMPKRLDSSGSEPAVGDPSAVVRANFEPMLDHLIVVIVTIPPVAPTQTGFQKCSWRYSPRDYCPTHYRGFAGRWSERGMGEDLFMPDLVLQEVKPPRRDPAWPSRTALVTEERPDLFRSCQTSTGCGD